MIRRMARPATVVSSDSSFRRGTVTDTRIWAFRAEAGRDSLVRPGKEMFEQVVCV